MNVTPPKASAARQRILETAERLFYLEGIHSVGIDRIIAEAEVAKMTLYNHFASKDELVLAVLEYRDQQVNDMFATGMQRRTRRGMDPLEAFFATLKQWFENADFRGCSFINATVELADPDHPAARFAVRHKQQLHQMLAEIVRDKLGPKSGDIAAAVGLLVEGAIVTAQMEQSSKPADVAKQATQTLIKKSKTR